MSTVLALPPVDTLLPAALLEPGATSRQDLAPARTVTISDYLAYLFHLFYLPYPLVLGDLSWLPIFPPVWGSELACFGGSELYQEQFLYFPLFLGVGQQEG